MTGLLQVTTKDILQASRNAWTARALQMLLGRDMGLTPAIFAYSMFYPYADNYLDDPATCTPWATCPRSKLTLRFASPF